MWNDHNISTYLLRSLWIFNGREQRESWLLLLRIDFTFSSHPDPLQKDPAGQASVPSDMWKHSLMSSRVSMKKLHLVTITSSWSLFLLRIWMPGFNQEQVWWKILYIDISYLKSLMYEWNYPISEQSDRLRPGCKTVIDHVNDFEMSTKHRSDHIQYVVGLMNVKIETSQYWSCWRFTALDGWFLEVWPRGKWFITMYYLVSVLKELPVWFGRQKTILEQFER